MRDKTSLLYTIKQDKDNEGILVVTNTITSLFQIGRLDLMPAFIKSSNQTETIFIASLIYILLNLKSKICNQRPVSLLHRYMNLLHSCVFTPWVIGRYIHHIASAFQSR